MDAGDELLTQLQTFAAGDLPSAALTEWVRDHAHALARERRPWLLGLLADAQAVAHAVATRRIPEEDAPAAFVTRAGARAGLLAVPGSGSTNR